MFHTFFQLLQVYRLKACMENPDGSFSLLKSAICFMRENIKSIPIPVNRRPANFRPARPDAAAPAGQNLRLAE